MLAIIKTGGKQYLVKKGTKVKIEKIEETDETILLYERCIPEKTFRGIALRLTDKNNLNTVEDVVIRDIEQK